MTHDHRLIGERDTIAVLDYGSQYSQLVTRRVRESNVYCEMLPWDASAAELDALNPKGIILAGGPPSGVEAAVPPLSPQVIARGVPILGIGYGLQVLSQTLGGSAAPAIDRVYDQASITVDRPASPLFAGLGSTLDAWLSHGDRIEAPPPGFAVLAHAASTPVAAMADEERRLYGLQFHPEVEQTPHGRALLRNFCVTICGCRDDWTTATFIAESIAAIRARVGTGKVICGVSGGVDSTVVATLVSRAVGDQLTAIFVDHGLLRKDEARECVARYRRYLDAPVVAVDASERFLAALEGVTDPERKRVIIGNTFIQVFEEEASRLGRVDFLAQGTLYPDVIESAAPGTSGARIKTHHNVGGLPENMRMALIEPLRFLFKDEVRRVGLELGLPEEMVYRAPFPGPGLAVRLLGPVTRERLEVLREADAIVRDEIAAAGLDREIWQYFAVLTPLRSVGVERDSRTYAHTVAVRAVTSEDAMTADWARIPYDVLARISQRIVSEVPGINRVVYDISSKPPATIEWE
jgi:GMP synthase (glutamine-hydrolysing)